MTFERLRAVPSQSFRRVARGLVDLHRLVREGKDDSSDADSIRDALDAPLADLSLTERERARWLSEDLYSLSASSNDSRDLPPLGQQRLIEMFEARTRGDLDVALEILRHLSPSMVPSNLSYLRGSIWFDAGLPEIAAEFWRHASETDPQNATVRCIYMDALSKAEPARAAKMAIDVLADHEHQAPKVVAQAANIQFQRTEGTPDSDSIRVYRELVPILVRNLERIRAQGGDSERSWEYEITAWKLGLCHELLGNSQKAVEFFSLGLQANPDNDGLLVARGILTYGTSPRAVDDFRRAIEVRSSLVWPYLFLSHNYLVTGRFDECRKMCEAGLGRGGSDAAKSRLEAWRAIAQSELGFPSDLVRMAFDSALRLDPENESARFNWKVFESGAAGHHPSQSADWRHESAAAVRRFGLVRSTEHFAASRSVA